MRIAPSLETFQFHPNPQEIQPLRDIYGIFGGSLFYSRKPFGLDTLNYNSEDQRVGGSSIPLGGIDPECSHTTIRVSELELHTQAARWTVVEAYRVKYYGQYETGSLLKNMPLIMIAPDQLVVQEGAAPNAPDLKIFSALTPLDLTSDSEIAAIQVKGHDLLSAAQMIANYCSEYGASSEMDASIAVAYALGATSMSQLEHAWGEAMAQSDPYSASAAASRTLLSGS